MDKLLESQLFIIRISNGQMISFHGSYNDAVKVAEENVKGTKYTYIVV